MTDTRYRTLGNYIRHIRLQRGLTQLEVTNGLFERAYLSQIEQGTRIPPVETLKIIATRLEVPAETFIRLIPKSDQLSKEKIAKRLHAKALKNNAAIEFHNAWLAFYELYNVEMMSQCITDWYKCTDIDASLIDAIKSTIIWAEIEGVPITEEIELSFILANTHFRLGHFTEAISIYKKLLEKRLDDFTKLRIRFNYASAAYELRDFHTSEELYSAVIECGLLDEKRLSKAYLGRAGCLRLMGLWEESMANMQEASRLSSETDKATFAQAQHSIGVLYLDRMDCNVALHYFDYAWKYYDAQDMKQPMAELCEEFTRANYYLGDFERALKWAKQGLELIDTTNPILSGHFFLWKSWILNKLRRDEQSFDAMLTATLLLDNKLHEMLKIIDPNATDEMVNLAKRFTKKLSQKSPKNFQLQYYNQIKA